MTLSSTAAAVVWIGAAFGAAPSTAPSVATMRITRIAVLQVAAGRSDRIAALLAGAGFSVRMVSCDDLIDESQFNRDLFDLLVIPHSRCYPAAGGSMLLRFVQKGGHLVLLEGPSLSEPLWKYHGRWSSWREIEQAIGSADGGPVRFNFEDGVAGWWRNTSFASRTAGVDTDAGRIGRCMRMSLKGFSEGWETRTAEWGVRPEAGANILRFWARSTPNTPEMEVELQEQDGTRWVHVVRMGQEWRAYVIPAARFRFWKDGSPANRGGAGDRLDMSRVARISFGLAYWLTGQAAGDHTLWVDEVGMCHADVPEGLGAAGECMLDTLVRDETDAFRGVTRIQTAAGQDLVEPLGSEVSGLEGHSALAVALPAQSVFVPLLEAIDGHGRRCGWASGLVIHYAGGCAGSAWLLFGPWSESFYASPLFDRVLIAAMRRMAQGGLATRAQSIDRQSRSDRLSLTTAAPSGMLRLSADRRHILHADGRRFFMVGGNYIGPFDRKCYLGGDLFDVHLMEDDFRKARDAGINILRFWLFGVENDPTRVASVRELARRYGIYLLLHLGPDVYTRKEVLARIMKAVRVFKDEPMVMGYDLMNEPHIGTVGGITIDGRKAAILDRRPFETFAGQYDTAWVETCVRNRPPWPQMHKWLNESDARQLYAAYSMWDRYRERFRLGGYTSFEGLVDALPSDAGAREFIGVVNDTFDAWIRFQVDAIRAEDPQRLITVGYNTALSCLPANRRLDFVSQHVYEVPGSREGVLRDLTTLDRLARVWPGQPITLGEFGCSNGMRVAQGYLDEDASSVGEMMHYLYALSQGYDGCMKWCLTDWPVAIMRFNVPWIPEAERLYQSGQGLYAYDGSVGGRPKSIAHGLRFLRQYIDREGLVGRLEVRPSDSPIGVSYVFRGPRSLFIGDAAWNSPELVYRTDRPTNMMLAWDDGSVHLMSTRDVAAALNPGHWVRGLRAESVGVEGRVGSTAVSGGMLRLELLGGECVLLKARVE